MQTEGNYDGIKVVIVDYYAKSEGRSEYVKSLSKSDIIHVPPKPTVWQGEHRLTQDNYFAASNARNTAICYAEDGQLAYVDDLSVLLPGWLGAVKFAASNNLIVFGVYQKVDKLKVFSGGVIDYEETVKGKDVRHEALKQQNKLGLQPCAGGWLFGCSLTFPVKILLDLNGWDEDCDSMGYEDVCLGQMITNRGIQCYIDTNMRTLEDDPAHFEDTPFRRIDKQGVLGHKDASHAMIAMLHKGRDRSPNYFGPEGISGLRTKILQGEQFPISKIPEHDWRDGQRIITM
jgi:hypothetical protein